MYIHIYIYIYIHLIFISTHEGDVKASARSSAGGRRRPRRLHIYIYIYVYLSLYTYIYICIYVWHSCPYRYPCRKKFFKRYPVLTRSTEYCTNCLGGGHGYECHSPYTILLAYYLSDCFSSITFGLIIRLSLLPAY